MTLFGAILIELSLFAMIAILIWFAYRVIRSYFPRMEAMDAYIFKKIRLEVEKRKIDFDEMMREYYSYASISPGKYRKRMPRTKGTLDRIDEQIEGIIEADKKKKKDE